MLNSRSLMLETGEIADETDKWFCSDVLTVRHNVEQKCHLCPSVSCECTTLLCRVLVFDIDHPIQMFSVK